MSAEKGKIYAFWVDFFRTAGILPGIDNKYALVFEDNRIQPDMLLDLTKECLRDMEITAMGDIIAILRHAKIAHDKSKTLAFGNAGNLARSVLPPAAPAIAVGTSTATVEVQPSLEIKKPTPLAVTKSTEKVTTTTPALPVASSVSKQAGSGKHHSNSNNTTKRDNAKSAKVVSNTVGDKDSNVKKLDTTTTNKTEGKEVAVAQTNKETLGKPITISNKEIKKQPVKPKRFIIVDQDSSSDSDVPEKRRKESPVPKKISSRPESSLLTVRLGPAVSSNKMNMNTSDIDTKGVFARLGRSQGNPCVSGEATIIRPSVSSSVTKCRTVESPSVFERLGGRGNGDGSGRGKSSTESNSSRRAADSSDSRSREQPQRETNKQEGLRRNVYEGTDRRITLRQRTPETPVERSGRVTREHRFSPSDERSSGPSRLRSDGGYRTPPRGNYRRTDSQVKSRVGFSSSTANSDEVSTGRKKVNTTNSFKKNSDLRVGQVVTVSRAARVRRSNRESVVQRVISRGKNRRRDLAFVNY